MRNIGGAADDVTALKNEVTYLKEKIESVSDSERARDIETQKLKIHDLKETKIGIFQLFVESKLYSAISFFSPLLPALLALALTRSFVTIILQEQTEVFEALDTMGFSFTPMLNNMAPLVPPIVCIVVYVLGFKVAGSISSAIVKSRLIQREKDKLKMLEFQR